MLNEERIRLMTRLALYEQKEGKKDLPLSKYYKSDYIALKLINSAIIMTVGYIVLLLTIALVNVEELLSELVNMDLLALGRNILIIYAVLFVVNMLATYIIYTYRFKKSRKNLNRYNAMLKEIYMMYRKEENSRAERSFEDFDEEPYENEHWNNDIADFGGINDDELIDD